MNPGKICAFLALMGMFTFLNACQRSGDGIGEEGGSADIPSSDIQTEKESAGMVIDGGAMSMANILFSPVGKAAVLFNVEVAATPEERTRGLQGRVSLGMKNGMWFIFDRDVRDAFWMKGTNISLDLIFADKNYKVVDIIANARPNSESLLIPDKDYRYVLEVAGGEAAENGITVGAKLEYRLGPP